MSIARERTDELAVLLRREHDSLADFLVALARFDAERLWKMLGYASLFDFLYRELGVSKGSAQYRKVAAELIQRCPEVVEPLRDGRICFTAFIELAKIATPENVREVLPLFFHRSRREAMDVVAELRPDEAPTRRTVVTPVRTSAPVIETGISMINGRGGSIVEPDAGSGERAIANPSAPRGPERRMDSEPMTGDLSRVHVTVPREFFALLDAARSALSHAKPGASDGEILVAGLKAIVDRCAKRRGLVRKPRKISAPALQVAAPAATPEATREGGGAPGSAPTPETIANPQRRREYIPADVRRAVWERDGGRCSFPLEGGGVCGSTYQLELDHVTPVALGGTSTVHDLRVACKPHNLDAARRVFGDAFIDACIRNRRAGGSGGTRVAARAQDAP